MDFIKTGTITNASLAFSLFCLAIVNAVVILFVIGKTIPHENAEFLKRTHRSIGYLFFLLYAFIGIIMINKLLGIMSTSPVLSPKATIHSYIGFSILPLILIKIGINKYYKKFYSGLPVYGVLILIAVYMQIPLHAALRLYDALKR
ncbi:MAG: hypothetical protein ACUBOA_04990 [Candidatus Loosdrechtia sp.]|uniref:hypothetical protein n=1 Tax=Candidatus Loosdrechtia sp. TaxID=3101272 RepID=UPI003A6E6202|nr:MAG: DUF6529 family protein [Candidatus Jettenia sp. AMX2]